MAPQCPGFHAAYPLQGHEHDLSISSQLAMQLSVSRCRNADHLHDTKQQKLLPAVVGKIYQRHSPWALLQSGCLQGTAQSSMARQPDAAGSGLVGCTELPSAPSTMGSCLLELPSHPTYYLQTNLVHTGGHIEVDHTDPAVPGQVRLAQQGDTHEKLKARTESGCSI